MNAPGCRSKKVLKPVRQREVVTYLMGRYRISERRAAMTARFHRSSLRYQSRRDPQRALRQRLRELARSRVRFGYCRLLVLLRREGWEVGKHRLYRVYTEEGLALRRKRPTRTPSFWISAGAANRRTTRPSNPSMVASARSV